MTAAPTPEERRRTFAGCCEHSDLWHDGHGCLRCDCKARSVTAAPTGERFLGSCLDTCLDTIHTSPMTQTGILAARINRNDVVEIEGQAKTVADYEMVGTNVRWTFSDETTYTISPVRYVTAWI